MKRSSQVALLLMGATTVGASGYALSPRSDCGAQAAPGAAVSADAPRTDCRSSRSSWHSYFSHSGSSRTSSATGVGSTTRGGFGSTGAHASGS